MRSSSVISRLKASARREPGQFEPAPQFRGGEVDVGRFPDRPDDGVEVVEGDLEALEDVGPRPRLAEVELGPAPDDLAPMVEVVDEDAAQRECLRLAVHEQGQAQGEREANWRV